MIGDDFSGKSSGYPHVHQETTGRIQNTPEKNVLGADFSLLKALDLGLMPPSYFSDMT
jgi:hypothetical protein